MKTSDTKLLLAIAAAAILAGCVSTTTGPPDSGEDDGDAAGINHQLAIQYFQNGNYELARDRLILSTELDPSRANVWSLLALTYEQLGNLRLADDAHQRALRTGSRNFDVQNTYAVYLCRQGRFDDAERQFERSIRAETNDNPEIMMTNAGVCFMQQPNLVKAEEWFRRALDRRPSHGEALLQMALLKHTSGDNLRARAFLQRYRELNPSGSGVLYLCVLIEDQLGDEKARTDCANQLLREFPNSQESRQLMQRAASADQSMNEQTNNEDGERPAGPADTGSDGPLAGQRLAAARREKQITIVEIAKELHLDEPKVRALEQNDFEVLGAPVFAKGHLRKYAMLVGVSIDDVLADYYTLNRTAGMPPVVGKVRKQQREFSPGPWIAVVVIIIIVATVFWWFIEREGSVSGSSSIVVPPADDAVVTQNESETVIAEPVEMPEANVGSSAPPFDDPQPVTEEPAGEPEVEAIEPAVATPPDDGQITVSMAFTDECWTEISDANGRRLFFNLGRSGSTATVSGEPPLSVLFGNADAVSLQVNGTDYTISAADRRGQTARFTILAP